MGIVTLLISASIPSTMVTVFISKAADGSVQASVCDDGCPLNETVCVQTALPDIVHVHVRCTELQYSYPVKYVSADWTIVWPSVARAQLS